eukprot:CAMPEP_0175055718 /NCGR_PEP_ID=MMETSP0052_2-20121109/10245_1 /TAXON_ID=51329 ORGANISM="Polytomella parva, Strain SAG 63-3" /NCGR_SAMPLE_ID=MMETSP0052_2 /ASSEMBLY_ACC=CAM_ASM_000194 /LENGTH=528 /DNA_ID=CAMNT_0016320613 /DNA_START=97 /DNA_END=1684 /DNA_ORIENTATION=-
MPFTAISAGPKGRQTSLLPLSGVLKSSLGLSKDVRKVSQVVKATHQILKDTASVKQYVNSNEALLKTLVNGNVSKLDAIRVEEVPDGKINYVYKVHGEGTSVVLKYAPPFVKIEGEDFKLSQERLRVESSALVLAREVCPEHTPSVLLYDPSASVLVTECLGLPLIRLSQGIAEKRVYHKFAEQIANLLSKQLFFTSRYFLDAKAFREKLAAFENREAVAANLNVVIDAPFDPQDRSNSVSPREDPFVDRIRSDQRVLDVVRHLRNLYVRRKEAIVHNDLHPNNLFVSADQLYLIDWEFSAGGPIAFDLGSLVGNLLLAACCLAPPPPPAKAGGVPHYAMENPPVYGDAAASGHYPNNSPSSAGSSTGAAATAAPSASSVTRDGREREWLMRTVDQILRGVVEKIRELESTLGGGEPLPEDFEERLLLDTAGFAACAIFRQVVGRHKFAPLASIVDPAVRRAAERRCLRAAFTLFRVCGSGMQLSRSSGKGGSQRRRQLLLFPGSDGSKAGGLSFIMDPAIQDQILMI